MNGKGSATIVTGGKYRADSRPMGFGRKDRCTARASLFWLVEGRDALVCLVGVDLAGDVRRYRPALWCKALICPAMVAISSIMAASRGAASTMATGTPRAEKTVAYSTPHRAAANDQQLASLARGVSDGLGTENERVVKGHAGRAERPRTGGDDDTRRPAVSPGRRRRRPPQCGRAPAAPRRPQDERCWPGSVARSRSQPLAVLADPGPDSGIHDPGGADSATP